jgi:hypothetical protein
MAITASKPAINIREKLAELDQPQGIKGTEVLRADTADEARNAIGARGRKNLIINGGFDVAQRGTTGTCSTDNYGQYLSVDRWSLYYNGSTVAQTEVNIPDGTNSLVKAAKVTVNNTTDERPWFSQRIEHGSKLLNNKTVSLSFWGRGNTTLDAKFRFRFQDDATAATNVVNGWSVTDDGYEFTLTSEWIKYEWTGVLVDTSVNNTRVLDLVVDAPTSTWSSGDWMEITQVQLELGDQATEFEHRSYGEELALCQRYYHRIHSGAVLGGLPSGTPYVAGGGLYCYYRFPTEMRAAPSLLVSNNIGDFRARHGNLVTFSTYAGFNGITSSSCILITASISGSIVGDMYWVEPNSTTALLALHAEL